MRLRSLVVGATVLLGLVAPSCGEEVATSDGSTWTAPAFAVGWVPGDFELVRRIEPTGAPVLSDDSSWGLEPYLLVVPDGWEGDPDAAAFVSLVDGTANEGGLLQGLPNWTSEDGPGTLDGRDAWRFPVRSVSGTYSAPPQVVVRAEGERGVRVRSVSAPFPVLEDLAAAAGLTGDEPSLSGVPSGWRVAGRVTGAQLGNLGVEPWYSDANDAWPGVRGGKVTIWTKGGVVLEIAVLPEADAVVDAAGPFRRVDGRWDRRGWEIERAGDRWWSTLDQTDPDGTTERHLERVGPGPDGHVLFVGVATDGTTPLPDRAALDRIARSIVVDDAGWSDARAAQRAAPPQPRAGREELARGSVDGTEWIVESDPDAAAEPHSVGANPYDIATHLVVTGGRVLGATSLSGDRAAVVATLDSLDSGEPPPFTATLVIVGPDVGEVAFSTDGPRAPTVPAGSGRVAVISPAVPGIGMTVIRYDSDGNPLP